jgi:hypothetical protein
MNQNFNDKLFVELLNEFLNSKKFEDKIFACSILKDLGKTLKQLYFKTDNEIIKKELHKTLIKLKDVLEKV